MGEGIFPLIDRRAPVLEGVRERMQNGEVTNPPDHLGKVVAKCVIENGEGGFNEEEFSEVLRGTLSRELDVPEEEICDEFVEEITMIFTGIYPSQVVKKPDVEREVGVEEPEEMKEEKEEEEDAEQEDEDVEEEERDEEDTDDEESDGTPF